jgi:hypothetical protein
MLQKNISFVKNIFLLSVFFHNILQSVGIKNAFLVFFRVNISLSIRIRKRELQMIFYMPEITGYYKQFIRDRYGGHGFLMHAAIV